MNNTSFWKGKRVFLTGHTGFKGSWLSIWLHMLGAELTGYALEPPTDPSLFELARVSKLMTSVIADVRDLERLKAELAAAAPDIVIHMAAQPLVRDSYKIPVETYAINVMGTVHLLEAVRACPSVRAVVNVTTDKVYENREWIWGYRENESFGGYDPYSNSKACSELVTAGYRSSYFNPVEYERHGVALASARAGNVIGGGDWAGDRLVPDILRAILAGEPVRIRNPHAIRPWQHVLEPLAGYLLLAERLYVDGGHCAEGWNFGPAEDDSWPVARMAQTLCELWGDGASCQIAEGSHPHEANLLKLDSTKARTILGWRPKWNVPLALQSIVTWARAFQRNEDLHQLCLQQIEAYLTTNIAGQGSPH